jgi:hypothetical protein
MTLMKRLLAVAGATAVLAFGAPAAFAQSGSDGYGGSYVVPGLESGGETGGSGESPAESTPTETTPTETTPAETAPAESAPAESKPAESTPAQTAPVQAAAEEGGSLPFTGADLGVLAAAGGILLGLGFGLRRLTHRPSH